MKRRGKPGFALATTFIVIFCVLLAGFTMATLATFNLNLSEDRQLGDEAFDAASSGLSWAILMLSESSTWGTNPADRLPEASIRSLAGLPPSTDAQNFYVTFSGDPAHPELPLSKNNINGGAQVVSASGRPVPPHSALLFLEGTAGSGGHLHRRILEALIQFPPYLYAIAASNAVMSWDATSGFNYDPADPTRAIVVDGVSGLDTGTSKDSVGGSVFAGGSYPPGNAAGFSVFLSSYSRVTGTVRCAGATDVVKFDPTVSNPVAPVASDIQSATSTDQVPVIDISTFDNKAQATHYDPASPPNILAGQCYFPGSVTLGRNGPVVLNNAVIYVDGNLTIPNGIQGPVDPGTGKNDLPASASIFVNGTCQVNTAAQPPDKGLTLISATGIAIFAQHDLTLAAVPGNQTSGTWGGYAPLFAGTLYSHGNIWLKDGMRFWGSILASAQTGNNIGNSGQYGAGNVFMEAGTHVTYYPEYSQFGNMWTTSYTPLPVPPNVKDPLLKVVYWRELPGF